MTKTSFKNQLNFLYNALLYLFNKIDTTTWMLGILIKIPAVECVIQDGYPVVTIEGDNGRIIKFYDQNFWANKDRWLDIKLEHNSYKHVNTKNVFVLFIYLPLTGKKYPLSHSCYRYMTPNDIDKVFRFRLTKRNYAMLDERTKFDREYIAKLRVSKYGAQTLDRIKDLNFNIIKN